MENETNFPSDKIQMPQAAIDERARMVEEWLRRGIPARTIQNWANDPAKRALINAMAWFNADRESLDRLVKGDD